MVSFDQKKKKKSERIGIEVFRTTIQKQDFLVHLFNILPSRKHPE